MELLGKTLFSKGKKVLNVGGGVKGVLPERFRDYKQVVLDIDPLVRPDICCDAMEMKRFIGRNTYDAVYSSHNLEHFYAHQVPVILGNMNYVLKSGGFVEIRVPDIITALKDMELRGLDLEDTLYMAPCGPIATLDMIYGYRKQIAASGQPFYAHKTAFTPKSMFRLLKETGFINAEIVQASLELQVLAYKP